MNKALILDRDGVINKEINYLHRSEDVEFVEGIFEMCKLFFDQGYTIVVVSNQAGIGRGYYSEDDFLKLTRWMTDQFATNGVNLSKVYYCPYHPTDGVGHYKKDSFDRKPKPGMILKARDEFDLDLALSILIGDKLSDIEAGINAGVGTNVLLGRSEMMGTVKPDVVINSLNELPKVLKLAK